MWKKVPILKSYLKAFWPAAILGPVFCGNKTAAMPSEGTENTRGLTLHYVHPTPHHESVAITKPSHQQKALTKNFEQF